MTVRLRLDIAYDGTAFSGWAVQPGRRTVAGVLGEALTTLLRTSVPMVVAGRTDAGVHATGQVAHIDVDPEALGALAPRHLRRGDRADALVGSRGEPAEALVGSRDEPAGGFAGSIVGLRRRLAGLLPADVRVPAVRIAPDGFDARFSALRRHYRYRVGTADWGVDPLRRSDTLAFRGPLDAAAMQSAADRLVGLHDFAAYCKPRAGGTTVRDLQRLAILADPPCAATGPHSAPGAGGQPAWRPRSAGGLVEIYVTADAFCHSMVRSLVGALLAVGQGRFAPWRPAELLAERLRTAQIEVAPAHGLTLVGVDYPEDARLAARAAMTRAVRDLPAAGPPAAGPSPRDPAL